MLLLSAIHPGSLLRSSRPLIWLTTFCVHTVAYGGEQKLFAAPIATQTGTGSGAGSLLQATLALALVLVAVFAAGWLLRRLRKISGGTSAHGIEVISQTALGAKERAVLLKVSGTHVLLGVAPGRVNLLHVLSADAVISPDNTSSKVAGDGQPAPAAPSFQTLLKRSLGLS